MFIFDKKKINGIQTPIESDFDKTTKFITHRGKEYTVDFTVRRDGAYPFDETHLQIKVRGATKGKIVAIEDAKDLAKIKAHIVDMLPKRTDLLNTIKSWNGKI